MQPLPILYVQNQDAVQALIAHYKREVEAQAQQFRLFNRPGTGPQLIPSGQTPAPALPGDTGVDWGNVLTRFLGSAIDLFGHFNGDPSQRKDAVLAAALQFYRDVIAPMVGAGIGHPFIFNTLIEPAIEKILPRLIGGVYDAIAGIFDRKAAAGTTTQPAAPVAPGLPAGFTPY